jgi:hypothetical protein
MVYSVEADLFFVVLRLEGNEFLTSYDIHEASLVCLCLPTLLMIYILSRVVSGTKHSTFFFHGCWRRRLKD